MHYAVMVPAGANTTANATWMAAFARQIEACGFESIVTVEHTVVASRRTSSYPYDRSGALPQADDTDLPDPLDLLAFLAATTSTLGLATGVLVLPNHHPVVLAKRLATVDALSGGRLRLCVGMGWMREEIEACGVDFESRGRRADEQIEVMRKLWTDRSTEGVDHHGEFFAFSGAMSYPKPTQAAGVPIHIGGHSKAAARRAGRHGNGLQPLRVEGQDLLGLVTLMREEAERAGRDPDSLQLSLGHDLTRIDPERSERLAAMGADRIVLSTPPIADIEEVKDLLLACAERLGLG